MTANSQPAITPTAELLVKRWKAARPYFTLEGCTTEAGLQSHWLRESRRPVSELHRTPGHAEPGVLMPPSVVTALEFLGGAVMAETATEDSAAMSGAPEATVALSADAIAAGIDHHLVRPLNNGGRSSSGNSAGDISLRPGARSGQPR